MKKPRGAVEEIGEEIKETVKKGGEQISLGKVFEEWLRQIFGGVKPLSAEEEKKLKEKEEAEKRQARAQVLEQFMLPSEEEPVYYKKQKEEAIEGVKKKKEAEKKAWEVTAATPKGRKKVGSLFEFLRRKVTHIERKVGDKF